MRPFVVALGCLACSFSPPSAAEQTPWRQRMEKAYRRAALGAELKYIDGLLANRAPGYMVIAPTGQRMDLSVERDRLAQLFEPATRVVFLTNIEKTEEQGKNALCWSEQILRVEKKEPSTGSLYTEIVTTKVVDQWIDLNGQPRMLASRVLSQNFTRGPQLDDDRLWPVKPVPVAGSKKKAGKTTK